VPPVHDPRAQISLLQRLEARFWTGPLGHLLGGALDVVSALTRHLVVRAVRAARTRLRGGR
jgi:hypothetical protein